MQDKIMLLISILIFVAMVFAFANQIAIDKKYEKCVDAELDLCASGEMLNAKECLDYALKKCEEVMK